MNPDPAPNSATGPSEPLSRTALLCLLSILLLHGACGVDSMIRKSATFDEYKHLRNGYAMLRPGVYEKKPDRDELINPPLITALTALPLALLEITVSESKSTDRDSEPHRSGYREQRVSLREKEAAHFATFPFDTSFDADSLLFRGRLAALFISLFAGLLVFSWARRLFGTGGGFTALVLYACSPNILAHARLVTADLGFAAAALFLCHRTWRGAATRKPWAILLAGLAAGLALLSKHSAILLLPPLILLFTLRWLKEDQKSGRHARYTSALAVMGLVALVVVFGGTALFMAPAHTDATDGLTAPESSGMLSGFVTIPMNLYTAGLRIVRDARMNAFLLGTHSLEGWWYYFPLAILMKTTIPSLCIMAAALLGCLTQTLKEGRNRLDEAFLWLPALFFLTMSSIRGINVGLRHILVIYPLLFILSGRLWPAAITFWRRSTVKSSLAGRARMLAPACLTVLLVWHGAAGAFIHPHYLAYFNPAWGGPEKGYRLMVDCNLDWGQDLKLLAEKLEQWGVEDVRLAYFGPTPPDYYGIDASPVTPENEMRPEPGNYAVSATRLQNLYGFQRNPHRFRWLRARIPDRMVGYSILFYRIDADEARRLGETEDYPGSS